MRAYESKTDAYRVFAKMLANGNPPDDWDSLLAAARLAERDLAGIVTPLRSVSMN
ncbi:Toxin YhaV [compost metagenome]